MSSLLQKVAQTGAGFLMKHKDELSKHAEQTARETAKGVITNIGNLFNKPKEPVQGTYATGTVPTVPVQQMHFGMRHLQLVDSIAKKKKRSPTSRTTRRSKRRSGARK
jgi:hypothetical protein